MSEPRSRAFLEPSGDWPPDVRAVATTRLGGLGTGPGTTFSLGMGGGADERSVAANRHRLRQQLALPTEPLWLQQVHGSDVVRAPDWLNQQETPRADGAWTDQPGAVCAVMTADCLPVVLAARDGSAVAVAHAGWRGLRDGVLEAASAALPQPAADQYSWLGPAIGPNRFEVGPEVRAALVDADPAHAHAFRAGRGDRWLADLYELARQRLRRAGVARIVGGGWCTGSQPELFFSHRRDGGTTGRMATLAWLEPQNSP